MQADPADAACGEHDPGTVSIRDTECRIEFFFYFEHEINERYMW
jgi:hypothetical protein